MNKLDYKLSMKIPKIIIFVDNCPGHPQILSDCLHFIKLMFLPQMMTSYMKPNVLHIFKALLIIIYYRRNLVLKKIDEIQENQWKRIIFLDSLKNIHDFFGQITPDPLLLKWFR